MKLQNRNKILFGMLAILAVLASICCPLEFNTAMADVAMQDIDLDGEIDIVIHRDEFNSQILMLETDTNLDGVIDLYEYQSDGKPIWIEKDSDFDGKIDSKRFYAGETIIREENYNQDGQLIKIIDFDEEEQVSRYRWDTNGDGRFDFVYYYHDGILISSTTDTNHDGEINLWKRFENDNVVEQIIDEDGDNLLDYIIWFDAEGNSRSNSQDTDKDGRLDSFRSYVRGELSEEKRDKDQDGRYEVITSFKNAFPVNRKMDKNLDGNFDVFVTIKNGNLSLEELDSNSDRVPDRFTFFNDKGTLKEIRDDSQYSGHIDRIRYFGKNEKMYLLTQDKNKDGKYDVRAFFNDQQEKEKVELDSSLDGKFDTWGTYDSKGLVRVEKDEDANERVDLVEFYTDSKRTKRIKDRDSDGSFEMTQWFNKPGWSIVMEVDGNPEVKSFFSQSQLKKKEIDTNSDGIIERIQTYNKDGKIIKIEKDEGSTGKINIIWYYNSDEKAIRAEKDTNLDGKIDVWFNYNNDMVSSVEEDTNLDGKPDLWEIYDESEALIQRKKDLDYDGIPDIIEDSQQDSNSIE